MINKGFYISCMCVFLGVMCPLKALWAQHDTTVLKPHVVTSRSYESLTESGVYRIDSLQTALMRHGTLADLLTTATPAAIRHYGPGQLSTAAIRGAAASQTVVAWNGLRINHPMLAQTDFGSIPAGVITSATLRTGTAALKTGSGAFGGVIDITSNLTDTSASILDGGYSAGSYGFRRVAATLRLHRKSYSSATYYYDEQSTNDFRYLDNFQTGNPILQRVNAATAMRGILHQSGLKLGTEGSVDVMIWAHQREIEIPYPIHQPQGKYDQQQSEGHLRMMLHARTRHKGVMLMSATGLQHGDMHYLESRSNTDALHTTASLQQRLGAEGIYRKVRWESHFDYELQHVVTSAYDREISRHIVAWFNQMLIPVTRFGWLGATLRTEHVPGFGTHWMPAVMAGFVPEASPQHTIKINILKNRQLPGLNDLYWVPGGNPDLQPETGMVYEATWEFRHKAAAAGFHFSITGFHQQVTQKIVWLPDSGALWSAFNVGQVQMDGGELSVKLSRTLGRFGLEWTGLGQLTHARRIGGNEETHGKQLIYVPPLSATSIIRLAAPWLTMSVNTRITGKRFTNIENSSWMPPYIVTNLYLMSNPYNIRRISLTANISVTNCFNTNYQMMAWYPMPRRMVRIGVNLGDKMKNEK